ncbi:hypothetical protein GCM10010412_066530 [Nonomuraea recticatena]|uniref:Uncharacterized protein n=2 Tax=Nonomuraea recticatena TaxID=46178 RepID=A0ABN3SNM1_9ACTN
MVTHNCRPAFSVMLLAFAAYVVGAIVARLRARAPATGEGVARRASRVLLASGGLVFVPWEVYWGLLTP